jgi:hypothetical protein
MPQLLRVGASITATALLLLVAAVVLAACLNLQGLIAPTHELLYMPWLAALSSPGGVLSDGLLKLVGGRGLTMFETCRSGKPCGWTVAMQSTLLSDMTVIDINQSINPSCICVTLF